MHASVGASTSEDVVAFEDRLRAARLAYTTIRAPIWTNSQYYMEFAFAAATGAGASGWHPSVFRVEQELERLRRPMVSVRKVSEADGAYVAELEVIGDEAVDTILAGLRANTTMFRDIAVLDDTPQADRRNLRVVRLRVRVE